MKSYGIACKLPVKTNKVNYTWYIMRDYSKQVPKFCTVEELVIYTKIDHLIAQITKSYLGNDIENSKTDLFYLLSILKEFRETYHPLYNITYNDIKNMVRLDEIYNVLSDIEKTYHRVLSYDSIDGAKYGFLSRITPYLDYYIKENQIQFYVFDLYSKEPVNLITLEEVNPDE